MKLHKVGQRIEFVRLNWALRAARRPEPMNFFQQFDRAHRLLICLPADAWGAATALSYLPGIKAHFPKAEITLLQDATLEQDSRVPKKMALLTYDRDRLNIWGLPDQSLRQQIRTAGFDVAMDLDLELDLLSVILLQNAQAPLRVCFDHPQKEALFNLIIRLGPERSWDTAFKTLLQVIRRD